MESKNNTDNKNVLDLLDQLAEVAGVEKFSSKIGMFTKNIEEQARVVQAEQHIPERDMNQFLSKVPEMYTESAKQLIQTTTSILTDQLGNPEQVADLLRKTWSKEQTKTDKEEKENGNDKL